MDRVIHLGIVFVALMFIGEILLSLIDESLCGRGWIIHPSPWRQPARACLGIVAAAVAVWFASL